MAPLAARGRDCACTTTNPNAEPTASAASVVQFRLNKIIIVTPLLLGRAWVADRIDAFGEDSRLPRLVANVRPLFDAPAVGSLHVRVFIDVVLLNDVRVPAAAARQQIRHA